MNEDNNEEMNSMDARSVFGNDYVDSIFKKIEDMEKQKED